MDTENIENKDTEITEISFENAISRLEELVAKLENGKAPLDESLKYFEEGVKLVGICKKQLEDAEQKVKVLKNGEID